MNDTVGSSVPMKYGANGKTTKANVYGPIFANFSRKNKGEREMKNQSAGVDFFNINPLY